MGARVLALLFASLLGMLPIAARAAACAEALRDALSGVVLRVAHYPYSSDLRVYVEASTVPGAAAFESARLLVAASRSARAVAEFPLAVREAASPGGSQAIFRLPKLPPGHYQARATFSTADCADLGGPAVAFEVRSFGWEHNRVGLDVGVFPPFKPLSVDGERVTAVLRVHAIDGTGLWSQVEAAERPLLAGAMRLEIVANGERQAVRPLEPRVRAMSSEAVRVDAEFRAGPLLVDVEGAFEIDGLHRVRLRVSGDPRTRVDRFDLVIPLRRDRVSLINAITDETRHHLLGSLPAGRGRVWNSVEAPRTQLEPGFVPYVWLGDEERGIAWMAESTRDFWFRAGDALLEVRRNAASTDLVVHFAASPGELGRTRTLSFALQATPVKPRPDHAGSWRLWQLACDAGAGFVNACAFPAGLYWGAATRYGDVKPRGDDATVLGWLARARAGGAPRPNFAKWLDGHGVRPRDRAEAIASLEYTQRVLSTHRPDSAMIYLNAQGASFGEEFGVYGDEWRPAPFGDREGRDEPLVQELRVLPRPSYRDYLLWHLAEILASGAADGVYFDNTFLRASWDEHVGTAWRDERGQLHPGVEIFAMRELLRRAQALVWKQRRGWWTVAHLTTTPISAIHGFSGLSLDGEWRYGDQDFPDRFPRDLVRASALGSQLGTVPVWLPGILSAPPARRAVLQRQLFGFAVVHEMRIADSMSGALGTWWELLRRNGYGDEACRVSRYWDPEPRVTLHGTDSEGLAVQCGDVVTVLVVGFDRGGPTQLRGVNGATSTCRDLERRGTVESSSDGCKFAMAPHDVRVIQFHTEARR